jgi:hypothetical protein
LILVSTAAGTAGCGRSNEQIKQAILADLPPGWELRIKDWPGNGKYITGYTGGYVLTTTVFPPGDLGGVNVYANDIDAQNGHWLVRFTLRNNKIDERKADQNLPYPSDAQWSYFQGVGTTFVNTVKAAFGR